MSFGYRNKFETTSDQHVDQDELAAELEPTDLPEGEEHATGPALEEPHGPAQDAEQDVEGDQE